MPRQGQTERGQIQLLFGVLIGTAVLDRQGQRPFERELSGIRKFEPISRSHPGFVDVLHVGINEDRTCFYYIMELGDDLAPPGQKCALESLL